MALPVGPGLLDIQLQLLEDMRPATVCSTASMALLLAEEVERRGLRERIGLMRKYETAATSKKTFTTLKICDNLSIRLVRVAPSPRFQTPRPLEERQWQCKPWTSRSSIGNR